MPNTEEEDEEGKEETLATISLAFTSLPAELFAPWPGSPSLLPWC